MPKDDDIIEELRQIRKLLAPAPAPPKPKGFIAEFMDFLSKYKVMGLAVAFIFAIYLGALVQALVNDLVMPIISLVSPGISDWKGITAGPFLIGDFIAALVTFIIVALVIFILVKVTKKWGIE